MAGSGTPPPRQPRTPAQRPGGQAVTPPRKPPQVVLIRKEEAAPPAARPAELAGPGSATAAPSPGIEAPQAPRVTAVVLAAGRGTRMGGPNKLVLPLAGRPIVDHVVAAAQASRWA